MADLRAIAQAVIDGPEVSVPGHDWNAEQDEDGYWSVNAAGDGTVTALHNHITFGPLEATHRHIAAWSPDRALAALDVIETTVTQHAEHYGSTPRGTCDVCDALDRWQALR